VQIDGTTEVVSLSALKNLVIRRLPSVHRKSLRRMVKSLLSGYLYRRIYMSDIEFIKFLCREICDMCSDGDEPDLETIGTELEKRGIDFDEVFEY
jgi:hypothetical protein